MDRITVTAWALCIAATSGVAGYVFAQAMRSQRRKPALALFILSLFAPAMAIVGLLVWGDTPFWPRGGWGTLIELLSISGWNLYIAAKVSGAPASTQPPFHWVLNRGDRVALGFAVGVPATVTFAVVGLLVAHSLGAI